MIAMSLYQKITESVTFHPAEAARELLKNAVAVETQLAEVRICKTRDGRWLYCGNAGNAIPCAVAGPAYQQIEAYTLEPSQEVLGGLPTRFLLRTAFECRFCYEKIVSLHAACVEVGDFAVAFTGPSGMG